MISIVSMRRPEYDLRVDLGTSNVLIHSAEHGLLVEESAVIAIETHPSGDVTRGRVLATGRAAQRMIGKVTGNIQVFLWNPSHNLFFARSKSLHPSFQPTSSTMGYCSQAVARCSIGLPKG